MVAFQVTQTGDPQFDVTLVVGDSAKEGRAGARELADIIYASAKVNNAGGQAFKNELMVALMARSERCKRAANAVLGNGSPKPVIGETSASESKECCN